MKLSVLNEAARLTPIKGLGLSLSKIKLFETCAYRYYLQYFAKETFDKEDFNPKFFKIGQFAHKYIESKIKGIECKFNSETLTDVDKQQIMGRCSSVFENDYLKSILDKGQAERGFSLYINPNEADGLEVNEKYSKNADFAGYIDFYAKIGTTLHIIDWKTGSIKGNDDDTFMQLMLYAKALQKLEGGSKFILSYFYIDHAEIVTREFNAASLDSHIDKIVKKGMDIPTQDNIKLFPANPGNACNYCPYSKIRSSDKKIVCDFAK